MARIKFFKLIKDQPVVTGGHIYDRNLFDTINKTVQTAKAEYVYIGCNKKMPKPLWPIIEFFKGVHHKNADVAVFNSSSCFHLVPLSWYLKIFSRAKVHIIHHHFGYLEFQGIKKLVYKFVERSFLKSAHKLIVPSPYIYEELKKDFKEDDLLLFRIPFESEAKFDAKPETGNLTFAGTIEYRKGLEYLLPALKQLQEENIPYQLNVMGKILDQAYYENLKTYAEKHHLNVNFLGFVDKETKEKILSTTDVFVFPSLLEGFGMVLVEAQVYGLPIVSFDNSAMPYTVKDRINGFTVPTYDSEALAQKIKEIITNRGLRDKLSRGALENLKDQWSQEKFEQKVEEYFSTNFQTKD